MAAHPSNPLDYAGSTPAPAAPVPQAGGGILTIGPTTYAVASIGAVQVQTDLEPRELAGWVCVMGAVFGVLFAIAAAATYAIADAPDARGNERTVAGWLLVVAFGLSPSFWGAWALRRRTRYQVALFVAGVPHVFIAPDQAAAFRLRDQIVAAMAAGGGTVYVDNRQVHVHKHG